LESGTKEYLKILKKNFPKEFNLRGLRIVIDCANGAGYKAGPELLKSLGAKGNCNWCKTKWNKY
jgi:phosphoglucosamine mutase